MAVARLQRPFTLEGEGERVPVPAGDARDPEVGHQLEVPLVVPQQDKLPLGRAQHLLLFVSQPFLARTFSQRRKTSKLLGVLGCRAVFAGDPGARYYRSGDGCGF